MIYTFRNAKHLMAKLDQEFYSPKDIEAEPMLYGASINFALEHGGPITQNAIQKILPEVQRLIPQHAAMGYHPIIDTKSVMLMPGQYPNIPGWHCDGVLRSDQNAQPNLKTLEEDISHFSVTASEHKDIPSTQFIAQQIELENIDPENVWATVDANVLNEIEGKTIDIVTPDNSTILHFKRDTLHRTTPAKIRGWRYFFRLSFYHMPAANRIRNQVQVYTDINNGW